VVFLLLVFFVWTASFQTVEQILPSQMSSQLGNQPTDPIDPPPEADFENLVIRIHWDGQQPEWEINDQPVADLAELKNRLTAVSQIKADAPLILHPDRNVPLGIVIEAYDVAKQSGFDKLSFAVNPSSS
jgi:biopolymer transport protein ExbD